MRVAAAYVPNFSMYVNQRKQPANVIGQPPLTIAQSIIFSFYTN
jgi:hypothetical protein